MKIYCTLLLQCLYACSVKANQVKLALLHGHNTSGHPLSGLEFSKARHSKVIQNCLETNVYDFTTNYEQCAAVQGGVLLKDQLTYPHTYN
jgi:hypothetical protein